MNGTKILNRHLIIPTIAVVLVLLSLVVFVESSTNLPEINTITDMPTEPQGQLIKLCAVPTLTAAEVCNPEIATQYGIIGYLDISSAPNTPDSLAMWEGEVSVTFLLRFVSYLPNITETQVTLDPSSGLGLSIEQVYHGGTINVNDLVSYNVSKIVTIKAGEVVPVALTIHKPSNFPYGVSFPAGPVGIMANVPIIDNTGVYVHG